MVGRHVSKEGKMSQTESKTRWYSVSNGVSQMRVAARSAEEALQAAAVDEAEEWPYFEETVWITLTARSEEEDGETARLLVRVDPVAPPCATEGEHEWVQVSAVCHGGGFIRHDRCFCGIERTTDTWASDDGRTSVRYDYYDAQETD